MKIKHFSTLLSSTSLLLTGRLLVLLALAVILLTQSAAGQHPAVPKLTLAQVEQLVSSKVPDSTLSAQIQGRGLAFTPTPAMIESLRGKGAGPQTLAAVEAHISNPPPNAQHARSVRTQRTLGHDFNRPVGIAVDERGRVFVSDYYNTGYLLKVISAADGYTTVTGICSAAALGVAVDGHDHIFLAGPHVIGDVVQAAVGCPHIRSFPGYTGNFVSVAVDDSGNVFVGDSPHRDWDGGVKEIPIGCDSESCIKVLGGGIQSPGGVAVDRSGNVYVADSHDRVLKKIPPGCASAICVRSLGGGFKYPSGVAVDKSGNVFVTDPENNAVKEIPPGCISASCVKTLGSGFNYPGGIAVDRSGNVFISDAGNNRVVELENAGTEAIQIATPGSANLAPFFGIWNKVGFHGGYVKVIISGSPERPRVHLWGAGSPQDSDDGEEDAIWDGSALNATFQQDGRPTVYRFTLDQNANLQLNCHYLRRNGTEASCVTMSYTR